MDIKDDFSELNLDDIMNEFHDDDSAEQGEGFSTEVLNDILKDLDMKPADAASEVPPAVAFPIPTSAPAPEAKPEPEAQPAPAEVPAAEAEAPAPQTDAKPAAEPVAADSGSLPPLQVLKKPSSPAPEIPEPAKTAEAPKKHHFFGSSQRLQELKRKLVAGPEKRYYDLSEKGVMRLQIGIVLNLLVLAGCVAITTMSYLGVFPENRTKFLVFSQILAVLVSGLLGCYLMLDGLGDLLRGRFSVYTMLLITFLACLADGVFCLQELRVPCCAAFSLEMVLAMLSVYHKRTTEMSQLDTMRKAAHLTSIVREQNFYDGKDVLLRGEGDVEDFMETYRTMSGPERAQNLFCLLSFLLCIGVAVLAGMLHGVSMGVQIFATGLLVAIPAGFFIALSRPAALLGKRLHMVGTVICGWQGVKKLCGKAMFPLTDEDLFPAGSTKFNGIKYYSNRNPDQVLSYTASLIIEAGGGMVQMFQQQLSNRNIKERTVQNFRDYGTGGIGGEVCGEPVLVGTHAFLQSMGVQIPDGTNVSQAVYAAIDGELCAVIAITYAKMRSATAGLVSLCGSSRVKPILLSNDFMLTEDFIHKKFGVSTRKMILPEKAERAELSKRKPDAEDDVLALTIRRDLVSAVYAATGAFALRRACRLGVIINIVGGSLGILTMLALAFLGNTDLLVPTNIFLYQLVWLIPGLLATEWTRTV